AALRALLRGRAGRRLGRTTLRRRAVGHLPHIGVGVVDLGQLIAGLLRTLVAPGRDLRETQLEPARQHGVLEVRATQLEGRLLRPGDVDAPGFRTREATQAAAPQVQRRHLFVV